MKKSPSESFHGQGSMTSIHSRRRGILRSFSVFVLVLSFFGAATPGQGVQSGSVPVNSGAAAKRSFPAQPSVGVIWLNLLRNENELYRAVTAMSVSTVKSYGEALSKDVLALMSCTQSFLWDRQNSLRDASVRVQDVTGHLSSFVTAHDSSAAAISLAQLDAAIQRLVWLFPPETLPAEVLAQFGVPTPESTAVVIGTRTYTDAAPEAQFGCAMHPEITSTKPGKCPKCQMALKELKH